jgi:Ran GTPase-activating protein (RanGAP) involved in mRNA processing and transport
MSGGTEFLSALSTNSNVLEIRMDRNNLSSQFPKPLKNLFYKNKTLSHVSMVGCKIGSIGGLQISQGLG